MDRKDSMSHEIAPLLSQSRNFQNVHLILQAPAWSLASQSKNTFISTTQATKQLPSLSRPFLCRNANRLTFLATFMSTPTSRLCIIDFFQRNLYKGQYSPVITTPTSGQYLHLGAHVPRDVSDSSTNSRFSSLERSSCTSQRAFDVRWSIGSWSYGDREEMPVKNSISCWS